MTGKYKIINEHVRENVIRIIDALTLDPVHEVQVYQYEPDRTAEQKGYYFHIVGIMAPGMGYRKDELHDVFKLQFLLPIYMADEKMKKYHGLIGIVNEKFKSGTMSRIEKDTIITALTSTNDAKLKHMRELIDNVQHLAADHGIRLPMLEH